MLKYNGYIFHNGTLRRLLLIHENDDGIQHTSTWIDGEYYDDEDYVIEYVVKCNPVYDTMDAFRANNPTNINEFLKIDLLTY